MYRLSICAAAFLAAVVIGCGPAKEMPDQVPTTAAKREPPPDPLGPVPASSEPAAKAVLERAVKAITQDKPERLEKAKVSIAIYKGVVFLPSSATRENPASVRWDVVWPDRAAVVYETKSSTGLLMNSISFRLKYPNGWMLLDGALQDRNATTIGRTVWTDVFSQHGIILGLTLADSRAVAFGLQKNTDPAGTTSVKIGLPDLPVIQVAFDDRSGLPVRVELYPLEEGFRPKKVLLLSEHKPEGDLVLPTTLEFLQNDQPGWKLKAEKWEFPEKIDEEKFAAPKQRVAGTE
jgi:hypothetical protein